MFIAALSQTVFESRYVDFFASSILFIYFKNTLDSILTCNMLSYTVPHFLDTSLRSGAVVTEVQRAYIT
jgi:hypothetical protein